jgi:REP element-mobilizing transposase RayT/predicted XRE-type DNA-binding protein
MIQGINKEYIFNKKENKEKYLYLMKKYYTKYKLNIIAYCIMNNHAHFIMYTQDIQNISSYMHKINSIYATDYNKNNKRVGYVFRDRYKSQYIYDRDYLFKCIKYVHMNPVKAKLVNREKDYIYSSYNDFKNKKGYVNDELIQFVFKNIDNYMNLFNNIDDVDVEIMDIENEDNNFEIAVNNYLLRNNMNIEKIRKSKIYLSDFTNEIINKGYKQKQIANILQISPSQISKILNKKSYPQNGNFLPRP